MWGKIGALALRVASSPVIVFERDLPGISVEVYRFTPARYECEVVSSVSGRMGRVEYRAAVFVGAGGAGGRLVIEGTTGTVGVRRMEVCEKLKRAVRPEPGPRPITVVSWIAWVTRSYSSPRLKGSLQMSFPAPPIWGVMRFVRGLLGGRIWILVAWLLVLGIGAALVLGGARRGLWQLLFPA